MFGAAGGNPYGATYASNGLGTPLEASLAAARHQGARLARYAQVVRSVREGGVPAAA